jgi:excinuclease ABC subunit B
VDDVAAVIGELQDEMQEAAGRLEFERAALLRDQINALKSGDYRKPTKVAAAYAPRKKSGAASGRTRR